jgi:hypothetical protein
MNAQVHSQVREAADRGCHVHVRSSTRFQGGVVFPFCRGTISRLVAQAEAGNGRPPPWQG